MAPQPSTPKKMAAAGFSGNATSDIYKVAFFKKWMKQWSPGKDKEGFHFSMKWMILCITRQNCGLHGEMSLQVVDFDQALDFDVLELYNRL